MLVIGQSHMINKIIVTKKNPAENYIVPELKYFNLKKILNIALISIRYVRKKHCATNRKIE